MNIKKNNLSVREGTTFVEMIIAIGVFSLMMVGITTFFAKSWQNYNYVMDTNSGSLSVSQTMGRMVENIRKARNADNGAYPIKSASGFDLVIFSDYDKDGITERLHYYLDDGNLKLGITKPTGVPPVYATNDGSISEILNNVTNNLSQLVFEYYDSSNTIISSPATNLSNIRMIKINLFVDGKSVNDIGSESFASIRNLSENDTIQ